MTARASGDASTHVQPVGVTRRDSRQRLLARVTRGAAMEMHSAGVTRRGYRQTRLAGPTGRQSLVQQSLRPYSTGCSPGQRTWAIADGQAISEPSTATACTGSCHRLRMAPQKAGLHIQTLVGCHSMHTIWEHIPVMIQGFGGGNGLLSFL